MKIAHYEQMMDYLTGPRERFRSGGIAKPKRGLVDEPGSYGGSGTTKSLGGGLYETTYKKGSKTYYTKIYDRKTGKDIKKSFGADKEAAVESLKKQKADRPKTKFEKIKEVKETKGTKEFQKITDKIDKKFNKVESKGYTNLREFRNEMKNLVTKDKFRNQFEIQNKINGYITDKFKDIQDVNTSSMEKALDKYNKAGGKERGTIDKIANEFGVNRETLEGNIQKTGRKKIPIKYGDIYEKRKAVSKKRAKAEKKFSDPSFESKMSGTKAVQKSHMDDLYSKVVTAETLGYAPEEINQVLLKDVDAYLNTLYKKRDKLIKNKPAGYKKAIEEINEKGIRVALATDGYKSFQIERPDGSTYQFGVEPGKTIDPTGITEGKQVKGGVEKVQFKPQTVVTEQLEGPDKGKITKERFGSKKQTATLTSNPVDQYLFEKNRQAVMESQAKVTKTKMKAIEKSLAAVGCPGKAMGGRIEFQTGATPTAQCILRGAEKINTGNIKPGAEARNASKFLNGAYKLGRGVLKFGVVPEALFVTGDSLLRIGMGDTLDEAFLRATDYLRTGDQTLEADANKISRIFDKKSADLFKDVSNFRTKQENFKGAKVNLEVDIAQNNPSLTGLTDQQVREIGENKIKKAQDELFMAQVPKEQEVLSDYKFDQAYDASKAQSFLTGQKLKGRQMGQIEDDPLQIDLGFTPKQKQSPFLDVRSILTQTPDSIFERVKKTYETGGYGQVGLEDSVQQAQKDYQDILQNFFSLKNAPLSALAASPMIGEEQIYGANPENFLQKQLPSGASFDPRLAYDFAGGGIAKLAGKSSGPPPESGPTPQGLDFLLNRGRKR